MVKKLFFVSLFQSKLGKMKIDNHVFFLSLRFTYLFEREGVGGRRRGREYPSRLPLSTMT